MLIGCGTSNKIRSGEVAYEQKQYAVAVDLLINEYEDTRNKAEQARKAYLVGESYMLMGETDEAVDWLEISYSKGYGPEVTQSLAKAYKKQGNYKGAIGKYRNLKAQVSGRNREIDREISVCEQVALWKPDATYSYDTQIIRASGPDMDYSATIFEDNYLVFTSDRKGSTGGDVYNWTGGYHSDLYIMPLRGNNPQKFDAIINSNANDGVACFSKDDMEIFFTRCYNDDDAKDATCKIMYSNRYHEVWTEPVPMVWTVDDVNYGHPALIEKDSVMIFSATLGESLGGHDLFYSQKVATDDGGFTWSLPEPMPYTINTQGEELFPVGDGDTLYYSSDYLPGYGGLDIFKTYLKENGTWAAPQNMKAPINSTADDYSLIIDYNAELRNSELQKGYFTSSRKGFGYDDLYTYTKVATTPPLDSSDIEQPLDLSKYILTLAIQTRTPKYIDIDDPNSGKIGYDKLSKAKVSITVDGTTVEKLSDENGVVLLEVEAGKTYDLAGSKSGYLNDRTSIITKVKDYPEDKLSITFNSKLTLDKIYYDKEIVLDNIYYDFDKWNIREDAKPTLDTLSILLKNNPQITIELNSHTDCQGDDEYNMILSQKRAQSSVDYILSKGISNRVVKARGYGETQPNIDCICDDCTEEQYQQNRRTSFRIVK